MMICSHPVPQTQAATAVRRASAGTYRSVLGLCVLALCAGAMFGWVHVTPLAQLRSN